MAQTSLLACGNVDKIRFFILGVFPLKKRVVDVFIASISAPLRIRKSLDRSYLPVFMVEVLYTTRVNIAVMDLWWLTGAQLLVVTKGAYR